MQIRGMDMDYINKNTFKGFWNLIIIACIMLLLFSSAYVIINVLLILGVLYGIYKLAGFLWVKAKDFYYSLNLSKNKKNYKYDIVEDSTYKEAFQMEKIIIDVEYKEL